MTVTIGFDGREARALGRRGNTESATVLHEPHRWVAERSVRWGVLRDSRASRESFRSKTCHAIRWLLPQRRRSKKFCLPDYLRWTKAVDDGDHDDHPRDQIQDEGHVAKAPFLESAIPRGGPGPRDPKRESINGRAR